MLCTRLPNSQRLLTSPSISGESSRDTKNLLLPLEPWQSLMPVLARSPSLFGPVSLCYNNEVFCLLLLLWSEQLNRSLIILSFCYLILSASLFSLDALVFEGWRASHRQQCELAHRHIGMKDQLLLWPKCMSTLLGIEMCKWAPYTKCCLFLGCCFALLNNWQGCACEDRDKSAELMSQPEEF